jgi:hypothetical protein
VSVLEIDEQKGGCSNACSAASKNEVAGVMEGALKIRLQVPP